MKKYPSIEEIEKEYDLRHKRWFERGLEKFGNEREVFIDKMNTEWHQLAKEFIPKLGSLKDKKVLEIGCGYGSFSVYVSHLGAVAYGIDLSSEAISLSNLNAHLFGKKIYFKQANATDIPFCDASFNLTVCLDTLEHIIDYQKAIREIKRVTKKNGDIIITTPNLLNPMGLYYKFSMGQPIENNFFYWTIQNELKKEGVEVIEVKTREFFGDKSEQWRRLENLLVNSPLKIFGLRIGVWGKNTGDRD